MGASGLKRVFPEDLGQETRIGQSPGRTRQRKPSLVNDMMPVVVPSR